MKILYAVTPSWDVYNEANDVHVFETKEMAQDYIEKYKQKYFDVHGEENSDLMWISEIKFMESVDEALCERISYIN